MNSYADIIINRKSPAVDRVFSYAVPEALAEQICPGMLVEVPFGKEVLEGVVVALSEQVAEGLKVREILRIVAEKPLFKQDLLALSSWMGEYYACSRVAAMQAMLPAGMTLAGRPPRLYYQDCYQLAPDWQAVRSTSKRQQLAEYLASRGPSTAADLAAAGFARSFLQAAVKAGLCSRSRQRIEVQADQPTLEPASLSPAQQEIFAHILAEQAGANRPYLLHGATGSGKTELYLRLIRQAAAEGRQSIVLVPEIALSAQMVAMLMQRLDLPIAVLHSGLKPTERRHIWQEIAEGRICCVVGARSALFAPLPDLGLIIIDEAHESSYKQDVTPRFQAVTVAEQRARLCNASLLLGSATPSVEQSFAARQGRYTSGQLEERFHAAPAPQVEVVDMRLELAAGNKTIFSRSLLTALSDTLAAGQQALLFLNRRGYYQHFSCRDCGSSISCPHCAVAMSYHADRGEARLKCHYCGRSMAPPQLCPYCGSKHIRKFGIGTQRVADELAQHFPTARIARLDSDVMREKGSHERIYQAMRGGEIDILVGTQMVAKGLDFPSLRLAAAIAADVVLNLPDWSAAERTYQLLTQMIGRAGRRDQQGLAIVQTYLPDAVPVQAASTHDYELFYEAELKNRQLHNYPPFCNLLRVLFQDLSQHQVERISAAFSHYLQDFLADAAVVLGPVDAPLAKVKDRYRRQLILKCSDLPAARQAVLAAAALLEKRERLPKSFQLTIDVDPLSMM